MHCNLTKESGIKQRGNKMKLSVFFDHVLEGVNQTGLSIPEFLKNVKDWGIDGLEINCNYLLQNPEIYKQIKAAGLSISCIYETHDFYNSSSFDSVKQHVDLAEKTGAKTILVIPGFMPQKVAEEFTDCSDYSEVSLKMKENKNICQISQMLQKTVDYAAEKNITVTLEDYDGSTSPCSHMNQLLWFMKNVKDLKYTFDMGNFAYSNEDNKKAFEILGEYIAHVHCKDRGVESDKIPLVNNKGLACVPVGDGYMNIDFFIPKLTGYNGYLAIEHFGAPDQFGYIKKSADFILKILSSR